MHCVQLIFVEADTHQEAIKNVEGKLEQADWSDWSQVGGRWEGMFGDDEPTNALNYANDPEVFMKWVNTFSEYRNSSMKSFLSDFEKEGKSLDEVVDKYDPRKNDYGVMGGYYLRSLGGILCDYWTSYSHMYDLEAGTANLEYLMERISKDPKKQFAVIVDFHH